MSADQVYSFLSEAEQDIYKFAVSELKNVFRSQAPGNMLKKFSEGFKKDDGKARDWQAIEGGLGKIQELHDNGLKEVNHLVDEFRKVIFP